MSQVLAGRVWESGLPGHMKPLAAAIADIVDRDGYGLFASIDYLAWLTGSSRRTVQDQMAQLRADGILVATCHEECNTTPGTNHGRGQTVEYRFLAEQLPAREPWEQVRARLRSTNRKGAESAPFADEERVQSTTEKGAAASTEGCSEQHPIRDLDPGVDPVSLLSLASTRKWLPVLHQAVEQASGGRSTPRPDWGAAEVARIHELGGDRAVANAIRTTVDAMRGATLASPRRGLDYGLGTLRNLVTQHEDRAAAEAALREEARP